MLDKELVQNKLADLKTYHQKIEKYSQEETIDIVKDDLKLHAIERIFQLIVDTAVDINTHLISELNLPMPGDYYSTFIVLGENKILPVDFSLRIAPSVGLRNLVVHKYGKVDIKKMVEDIKNEAGDYLEYMRFVEKFVSEV